MEQSHYLIPNNTNGFENNIEWSVLRTSTEDAEDCFVGAKERLLDVNNWSKYSGSGVALLLMDARNKPLNRKAHKGDHVQITTASVNHLVLVEAIEYDDYPDVDRETFAVRLKSASDPKTGEDIPDNYATATIVIDRLHKRLTASYHCRNEACAWLGISDEQWGNLMKGLLG